MDILNPNTNEDEKTRTDYIYMVTGHTMVISLNAELDHHLWFEP